MVRDFGEEEDREYFKLYSLLFGIGLFVVSAFYSFNELDYAIRGRTAAATSMRKHETTNGHRNGPTVLNVQYEFPDTDGTVRKEYDIVPLDWTFPAATPLQIQFIPKSAYSSRLAGHTHPFWVFTFFASFIPIGYACYKFWRFYKS
jgi:hypothetical protein